MKLNGERLAEIEARFDQANKDSIACGYDKGDWYEGAYSYKNLGADFAYLLAEIRRVRHDARAEAFSESSKEACGINGHMARFCSQKAATESELAKEIK